MGNIEYAKGKTVASATQKIVTSLFIGVLAGILTTTFWKWQVALLAAWDASALTYLAWTWFSVWPMDGKLTASHAVREDPSRATADAFLLTAVMGSIVAVCFMLAASSGKTDGAQLLGVAFSIVSIIISWLALHTLFMLHYAEEYYRAPEGGVDFGETKHPSYHDFAYLAFTVGMCFQVSDTQLSYKKMRRTALRHALISYVFGTLIIAATVNLIAGLGK